MLVLQTSHRWPEALVLHPMFPVKAYQNLGLHCRCLSRYLLWPINFRPQFIRSSHGFFQSLLFQSVHASRLQPSSSRSRRFFLRLGNDPPNLILDPTCRRHHCHRRRHHRRRHHRRRRRQLRYVERVDQLGVIPTARFVTCPPKTCLPCEVGMIFYPYLSLPLKTAINTPPLASELLEKESRWEGTG